jgi:hypothetical protein
MSATVNWCEDHGAATGSPARGTVRDGHGADTNYAVNCSWKSADDTNTTPSSSAKITGHPNSSFEKFQYVKFGGTFNTIRNVKWTAHATPGDIDAAYPGLLKLTGIVTSTYTTPSQSENAALTRDFTDQVHVFVGLPVLLHTSGPEGTSPTAELTAPGYTQYLVSQFRALAGAPTSGAPANIPAIGEMISWEED